MITTVIVIAKKLIKLSKKSAPQATVVNEPTLLRNDGWQFRCNLPRKGLKTNSWYLNLPKECLVYIGKLYNPTKQEKKKGANVSVWTKPRPNYDG